MFSIVRNVISVSSVKSQVRSLLSHSLRVFSECHCLCLFRKSENFPKIWKLYSSLDYSAVLTLLIILLCIDGCQGHQRGRRALTSFWPCIGDRGSDSWLVFPGRHTGESLLLQENKKKVINYLDKSYPSCCVYSSNSQIKYD